MTAVRHSAVDEVGDISAEPGSRPWAVALRLRMQAALNDERSSATHLRRMMDILVKFKGYLALEDQAGVAFASFESFCRAPMPYGLGYDIAAINAIIDERKTAEARATDAKPMPSREIGTGKAGPGRGNKTDSQRIRLGETSEYLAARIARDHPEVLNKMKAGEFKSVRQAALSVGIVRPRASVYVDDPDAVSSFLAKHFDAGDIKRIADLAVHIREGQ